MNFLTAITTAFAASLLSIALLSGCQPQENTSEENAENTKENTANTPADPNSPPPGKGTYNPYTKTWSK